MYGYGWSVHKQHACWHIGNQSIQHVAGLGLGRSAPRLENVRIACKCIAPPPLFGMTNPGQQQNKRFVKPLDCNRFCPDGSSSFRRWPEPRNWPQHWVDPWMHNFQGDISLDHVAWFYDMCKFAILRPTGWNIQKYASIWSSESNAPLQLPFGLSNHVAWDW